jgi:hypothetical protein
MCDGMEGEAWEGTISSWTLRSKIWEDAGEWIRGDEWMGSLGEVVRDGP